MMRFSTNAGTFETFEDSQAWFMKIRYRNINFWQSSKKILNVQVVYKFTLKVAPKSSLHLPVAVKNDKARQFQFLLCSSGMVLLDARIQGGGLVLTQCPTQQGWLNFWETLNMTNNMTLVGSSFYRTLHSWKKNPCRTVSQECGCSLRTRQPKCPGETRWNPVFKAI